jgi:vacuolar-type H+-ATPase subunit E/Vma4
MSLEKIREEVLSQARAEAKLVMDGARKHADAALDARKREATGEFDRLYKARTALIEDELSRKLIHFKGVAAKQVLEKRNGLLRSLFEKARQEILNWPEDGYGELMHRLIEAAAGPSGGRLRVHGDERKLFEAILVNVNKHRGPREKIIVDDEKLLHKRGGFIFVAEDYEIDQSLGTMLKDIEQEMLPLVAAALFPA